MASDRFLTGIARQFRCVVTVVWAAFASSACLADLPSGLTCPPEPVVPGDNCVPALEGAAVGCLTAPQVACLAGTRTSCTCIADECPLPADVCYPEGDCPQEVRDKVQGEPQCIKLEPKDIGAGLPSESQCLCGCAGCLAVCDGKGPVLAVKHDGQVEPNPLLINLAGRMPDSGKIGIFIRERGLSGAVLGVIKGEDPNFELVTYYYVISPIGTEPTSQIYYDDPFLGTTEYSWKEAKDKPTALVIAAGEGTTVNPQLTLMEIDCVIPFVVAEP